MSYGGSLIQAEKTEHLDKVKKSFEEYTKKMEEFNLKPYERKKVAHKG